MRRSWDLFPSRWCSFVALAGGDGEDGAHLPVLADEAVALVALRNAGAGRPVRPQATDFWIRWTPGEGNRQSRGIKSFRSQYGTATLSDRYNNGKICRFAQHFSGNRTCATQQANTKVFLYIDIKINLRI